MKHIAMIGAGISGLMSALELLEQGCSVSIFDQQQSGQAASWAGGGILSNVSVALSGCGKCAGAIGQN